VTLANAPGTGVADDKSTYLYVPQMIEFYLGEKPLISNVPTYMLGKPDDLAYTLAHLPELVVKEVQGSGGYGMLVGPTCLARGDRGVREEAHRGARQLHRPADPLAVHMSRLRRGGRGAPA